MNDALLGLVLLLGVALVAIGVHMIYEPAAYIWVGGCLLLVGTRLVRTRTAS